MTAESVSAKLISDSLIETLQWGRGQMTAESKRAPAATVYLGELQWGRGQMTAESVGLPGVRRGGREASMGPRSDDRGEVARFPSSTLAGTLQWGRGQMTAESLAPAEAIR